MDIDDELESLASKQTREWWDCSLPSGANPAALNDLRTRLLEHVQFFLIRIYLHLPYLLKPQPSHLYRINRLTALDSARELIRRFQAVRSYVDGVPVFECQSIDFMGFMAAVVLLLGISCTSDVPSTKDDTRLIKDAIDIFQTLAASGNNQVASQCHSTLTLLLSLFDHDEGSDRTSLPSKIFIPYFGTLYVSFKSKSHAQVKQSYSEPRDPPANDTG